jgi:hypothetical protein
VEDEHAPERWTLADVATWMGRDRARPHEAEDATFQRWPSGSLK